MSAAGDARRFGATGMAELHEAGAAAVHESPRPLLERLDELPFV